MKTQLIHQLPDTDLAPQAFALVLSEGERLQRELGQNNAQTPHPLSVARRNAASALELIIRGLTDQGVGFVQEWVVTEQEGLGIEISPFPSHRVKITLHVDKNSITVARTASQRNFNIEQGRTTHTPTKPSVARIARTENGMQFRVGSGLDHRFTGAEIMEREQRKLAFYHNGRKVS